MSTDGVWLNISWRRIDLVCLGYPSLNTKIIKLKKKKLIYFKDIPLCTSIILFKFPMSKTSAWQWHVLLNLLQNAGRRSLYYTGHANIWGSLCSSKCKHTLERLWVVRINPLCAELLWGNIKVYFILYHFSILRMNRLLKSFLMEDSGQGAVSIRKTVLPGMAIPMLKIRRPNGRLIFNMEIAIRR